MSTDLREELTALAETQTFSPDPTAWDRGRRARRNSRVLRAAAVAAVVAIVVGVGAIAVQPDREAPQPADVPGGMLPSRVDLRNADFGADFETDWAIGRASVALEGNGLVLIGAENGVYHRFGVVADVVALSPDGYRVAWWSRGSLDPNRISIADLRTGDVMEWAHNLGRGADVTSMQWQADSAQLLWNGRDDGEGVTAVIDVNGPSEEALLPGRYGSRGLASPSGDIIALASDGEVRAAPFRQLPPLGSRRRAGIPVERPLPTDLYPSGAVVNPVGWADEDTVVAIIDPPPSDVTEHPRLALLTSPDVPESQWIVREFLPRLPPEATSFAVDLIPELTGDPDQELTHDFTASPPADAGRSNRAPLVAGGVMALLAGLAFIRMMQKRA